MTDLKSFSENDPLGVMKSKAKSGASKQTLRSRLKEANDFFIVI